MAKQTQYVAAVDQGTTTSFRCMIFDHQGRVVAADQIEHTQIFPQPDRVEHNPVEIWDNTRGRGRSTGQRLPRIK